MLPNLISSSNFMSFSILIVVNLFLFYILLHLISIPNMHIHVRSPTAAWARYQWSHAPHLWMTLCLSSSYSNCQYFLGGHEASWTLPPSMLESPVAWPCVVTEGAMRSWMCYCVMPRKHHFLAFHLPLVLTFLRRHIRPLMDYLFLNSRKMHCSSSIFAHKLVTLCSLSFSYIKKHWQVLF